MFKNIASLSVKFFGAMISYLLTIYLSKKWGNEKVGYFSFLMSYALLYLLVLKLGTDIYLMKWTSRFHTTQENGKGKYLYLKLLKYHLAVGGIITAFGVITTPFLFNTFFSHYADIRFFQIGIASVFFMNLHILNYEFLRGTLQVISYTFYHTVSAFLFTLLLLLFFNSADIIFPHQLEISYLLAVIFSAFLSMFQVGTQLRKFRTTPIPNLSIQSILKDSFPFFSNNIVFVLIGTVDIMILSYFIEPKAIGEYAILVKIATFVSFPLTVIGANFTPNISGFPDKKVLEKALRHQVKIIILLTLLLFTLIALVITPITNFFYIQNNSGIWIFSLVGAGYLMSSFFALNDACLQMLGEEKLYQKIMLAACLLNVLLHLLLIPMFKETGAAVASMTTLLFWNMSGAYFTRKKLHLSIHQISKS
jgi:O-antigen/teichoic acid export membrane protein